MRPCGMSNCDNWHNNAGFWCDDCTPDPIKPKSSAAYDALPEQVRGIGIVTTRRILVHRPKSVRRTTPVNSFTNWSYSDTRDDAELDRRGARVIREPRERETRNISVAQSRAERLRRIAGTIRMGEQD